MTWKVRPHIQSGLCKLLQDFKIKEIIIEQTPISNHKKYSNVLGTLPDSSYYVDIGTIISILVTQECIHIFYFPKIKKKVMIIVTN